MTATEQLIREALDAAASRHAPAPGAWVRNQARLRRARRRRAAGWSAVTVTAAAAVAVTALAVAGPAARVAPLPPADTPAVSASATVPKPVHALGEPVLHGMSAADAAVLGRKCIASFLEPVQELPEERLTRPAGSYEVIFGVPHTATPWNVGDVIALHSRGEVAMCTGTLTSPGMAHSTEGLSRDWLTDPVEGNVSRGGSDGSWEASGRYTADVARVELLPTPTNGPGQVWMGNGVWFGAGVADGPVLGSRRSAYPRVRGYAADGRLLYDSTKPSVAECYRAPDGRTYDFMGEPAAGAGCARTWRWP